MVFLLRHVENGEILILGLNRTYTLGRSRRNSIHLTDVTVNNSHATLEITNVHADIEDKDSDFGTWVNKQRISDPFRLRNGDVIVFGKKLCKYVFLEPKFEALIDKHIPNPTKCMVTETLKELNVSLAQTYTRSCTHYVVESVSLDTLKEKPILYSLIDRKTVITPKYFVNMLANIKEAPLMPNIYRYMPEIDSYLKSKGIEDIRPRINRRHIFDNMVFIIFDKQIDQELCDLVIKCGGDCVLYDHKQNNLEPLFRDINRYQYIAVNHHTDLQNKSVINSFMRLMKQKKKKVSEISVDDVYVSILKGGLVGVKEELSCLEEPQPGYSKIRDVINLDSSDQESIAESDPVDIVCQIITDKARKKPEPLNTFSRLASAYKEQKTLRETVLETHAKSPVLNRWISRFAKKDPGKALQTCVKNSITQNIETDKNENNCNIFPNTLTNDKEDLEVADNNIKENGFSEQPESTSFITQRKTSKVKLSRDKRKKNENDVLDSPFNGKRNCEPNGRKKSLVINPFAGETPAKRQKEKQDNRPAMDNWLKKYKNVEITPMT